MYMDQIKIPERCKECVFIKELEIKCMLGRSLSMSNGCPNRETEKQYILNTFNQ